MHATPVGTRFTTVRCVGALGALSSISAVGTICAPTLVHQPFLLVLMSPRLLFLVLAASQVSPWVLIPAAIVRLCLGDVFHFHLGAHGVHRQLALHPRLQVRRLVDARRSLHQSKPVVAVRAWLRGWAPVARHGILVAILVRPIGRHLIIAGATGVCARRVAVVDVVGTAAYVCVVVFGASSVLW